MTTIFALGVASVILPIVLGARFLTSFFSAYHSYIFAAGSMLMIGVGIMALLGKRIPMPFTKKLPSPQVTNASTAYLLGVVSGISSACCAPVILGALTLAAISPTVLQAGAIGLAYTFGMVFPLFILGVFYKKGLARYTSKLQRKTVRIKNFTTPLANFLSFIVFTAAGLFFLVLAVLGENTTSEQGAELSVELKRWIDTITEPLRAVPYSEGIFGLVLVGLLVLIGRLVYKELRQPNDPEDER
jgi:cytochrome c-type biogenesis protein